MGVTKLWSVFFNFITSESKSRKWIKILNIETTIQNRLGPVFIIHQEDVYEGKCSVVRNIHPR